MSDFIEVEGKKYFEASYLELANKNTQRAKETVAILLSACRAQHDAIDRLFARLVLAEPGFFPSQSGQPWAALVEGNKAIREANGE